MATTKYFPPKNLNFVTSAQVQILTEQVQELNCFSLIHSSALCLSSTYKTNIQKQELWMTFHHQNLPFSIGDLKIRHWETCDLIVLYTVNSRLLDTPLLQTPAVTDKIKPHPPGESIEVWLKMTPAIVGSRYYGLQTTSRGVRYNKSWLYTHLPKGL